MEVFGEIRGRSWCSEVWLGMPGLWRGGARSRSGVIGQLGRQRVGLAGMGP